MGNICHNLLSHFFFIYLFSSLSLTPSHPLYLPFSRFVIWFFFSVGEEGRKSILYAEYVREFFMTHTEKKWKKRRFPFAQEFFDLCWKYIYALISIERIISNYYILIAIHFSILYAGSLFSTNCSLWSQQKVSILFVSFLFWQENISVILYLFSFPWFLFNF